MHVVTIAALNTRVKDQLELCLVLLSVVCVSELGRTPGSPASGGPHYDWHQWGWDLPLVRDSPHHPHQALCLGPAEVRGLTNHYLSCTVTVL